VGKTQALRDGLDAVLAVALGASCAACGELLEHPTGGPVCGACWQSIAAQTPPLVQVSAVIERAQAIGLHEGALRSIIHALKYEGRRSLSTPLARLIRDRCGYVLEAADVAVPVPLHPSRRRQRGFNQALDLARGLGLPVRRALRRVRATGSQTGLSASERHQNVRRAFAASRLPWRSRSIRGRVVVLVDDVSTTGATLEECARVLNDMGAREVRAVTAARVVTSPR
jgi:ComF family protein